MGTAKGLIAQGRKLLGTGERAGHPNSNFVVDWFNKAIARIGDGPWCDMSVSYEAAHSDNLPAVGGGFAYVPAHAEWFRSHGRWHYGIHGIKPGDVVFYEWNGRHTTQADHVGIVERVFSNGTIYSLEGNIGDAFRREHRDSTYVAGYGRPVFTGDKKANYDMPDRYSLGATDTIHAPAGAWTILKFNLQYDPADPHHSRGNWANLVTGPADYSASVDLKLSAPVNGKLRLVEADPQHGYKIVKEKAPVKFVNDDQPTLAQPGRHVNSGNHLYVQIRPDADVTVLPDRHAEVIYWRH